MKRRAFIAFLVANLGCPLVGYAQSRMPRVGVLGSGSANAYRERLTQIKGALAEAGFVEGRTVSIDYRWAEGKLDQLPQLAADLVGLGVDVIIATGGLQASQAAISATRTIPIVFSTDGDPVQQGLVTSLNRPGGNATGITVFSASLTAKRLETFRELVPKARVFAVLVNPSAVQAEEQLQDAEEAGHALGVEVRVIDARREADFEPALSLLAGVDHAPLLVSADPLFLANRDALVTAANRHGIPAIYGRRDFVTAGGLASYGADLAEPYRMMGTYAARVLKGEKVGDLPVLQPTKFEFVVNLKTAKALGITMPQSVLARVDELIE